MKILTKTIIFLGLIAVVLEMGNIYLSNIHSVESISAGKLSSEISGLSEKNDNLSTQVMQLSSYETVSSRAAELGFVESKDSISLFTPEPLALEKR